jgi:hypothetical protein
MASVAIARTTLVARREVDHVMKVALLFRVCRGILTGEDSDEANVVGPITQDLKSLHEPGEPVALDAHLFLDLGGSLRRTRLLDGSGRLGGSDLGWRGLGAAVGGCLRSDLRGS